MSIRAQFRRGTGTEWNNINPILAMGEIGYTIDLNRFKIGDGTRNWRDLPYVAAGGNGTLTSITAGDGLIGGTISTSGTLAIDETIVMTTSTKQDVFNKTLKSPTETINRISHDGGALFINVALANDHYINLAGNVQNMIFQGIDHAFNMLYIRLVFESTGIYTVNWPTNIIWPNDQLPVLSGSGKIDIIGLMTFDDGISFFGKKESSNISI